MIKTKTTKTRLCKNDTVTVITGNDKGKVGKVLKINGDRIFVEGVNVRKKHMKPTQQNQKGQIIDIEGGIHISNVRPSSGGNCVKLRAQFGRDGEKELCYLEEGKAVRYRPAKLKKNR